MRSCPTCGDEFDGPPSKIYCSTVCGRRKPPPSSPAVREALRELAVDKSMVREVLAEEIRDQIGQHVRDNLLGSIEEMVGLGPMVVSALKEDMETKDWAVRSRAYQYWLRYILPFVKDTQKEDASDRTVVIVHSIPAPDMNAEIIEGEAEPFERDWSVCTSCDERRHPDNMHEGVCAACRARRQFKLERSLEG